ncbi:MAG: glycosyltransferase family 2 protein [Elusimicrobiales bacterium]
MSIKLSICIPTYNRAEYLPDLFDSIFSQVNNDNEDLLEVVVSDNASGDDTIEVVNSYKNKFKNFVYFRWDRNMGADANFLKVVELSKGEYCWLMGSDDKILDNGIDRVLEFLNKNKGISGLSVNRKAYNKNFQFEIKIKPIIKDAKKDIILKDFNVFLELFHYWGYISGQVIRRELWNKVINNTGEKIKEYFNAYVHVYVISRMFLENGCWGYIHSPCVGWRSDNDSFLSDLGTIKRMKLDVVGYEKILRDLFGSDSRVYKEINKEILLAHIRNHLFEIKFNSRDLKFKDYIKIFNILHPYYKRYLIFWFFHVPLLFCPLFVLKIIKKIYRLTIKRLLAN